MQMARLWTLLRRSILHYIRAQRPDHPIYPYTAASRAAAKADLREYANSLQRLVSLLVMPLERLQTMRPACKAL